MTKRHTIEVPVSDGDTDAVQTERFEEDGVVLSKEMLEELRNGSSIL